MIKSLCKRGFYFFRIVKFITMSDSTNNPVTINQRRTLITVGLGLAALFPFLKFGFLRKSKNIISCSPGGPEPKTFKFLTEDGKLVEVAATKIHSSKDTKEKISNKAVIDWVKRG